MFDVARKLTDLRRQHGYSKEDLADILQVADAAVYEWERGESLPTEEELERLSNLYQLPVEAILTNEYIPAAESRYNGRRFDGLFTKQMAASFPILVVLAFLGLGMTFNLWRVAWLVFLAIPLYYTIADGRNRGQGIVNDGSFPIIVVAVYLLAGMLFNRWHPSWVIFFTIPLYYTLGRKE